MIWLIVLLWDEIVLLWSCAAVFFNDKVMKVTIGYIRMRLDILELKIAMYKKRLDEYESMYDVK